jgi:ribosomal protein S18 acetylase RimI-like enzyme
MIRIEQITLDNLAVFKEVRLRALQESPWAFGSTYAREREFTDGEWKARLERWNGVNGIGFVVMDDDIACGIAGALRDQTDATRAQLVSMWTAPTHRRKGTGRLLVDEVVRWAVQRGMEELQLMVTSQNDAAMRFYAQLGFTRTGRVQPYPNDPSLMEYEMAKQLPCSL